MTNESPPASAPVSRRDWTAQEVSATVEDYFAMYAKELRSEPYSKTDHRQALSAQLDARSDRAIEEKRGNISAILAEQGLPFIDGYKPRTHYQRLLREVVLAKLAAITEPIVPLATEGEPVQPSDDPFRHPPPRAWQPQVPGRGRVQRGRDYAALAQENSALGRAGELFVVEVERRRLQRAGLDRLAERVEHVAVTQGDGLGYDVLSFSTDDDEPRELHIEVKTTRYGASTPFYVSAAELDHSRDNSESFRLYRVYDWPNPCVYVLDGSLEAHFRLQPSTYRALR